MTHFASLILISWAALGSCDLTALLSSAPEEHDSVALSLTNGILPSWLKGALYRVGPGLFEHGGRSVNSVVDGLAKVHGWIFDGDGTVKYTARMTPSYIYNKTMKDNFLAPYAVMGDVSPDFSIKEMLEVMMGGIEKKDNVNVAVWDLDGGKSVTLTTESPMMQQVLPRSLKYKGPLLSEAVVELDSTRTPLFSATHYAKHASGTSINYVLTMSKLPWQMSEVSYDFYMYLPTKTGEVKTRKIGSIPMSTSDLRMLHMFGATENFVVVPLWNYQFFPGSMNIVYDMTHMCQSMRFTYDNPFYLYVMSIATGAIFKFELPPARGVHIMNTFERINEKGEIELVMDAPTTSDVNEIDLNKLCLFDVLKIPNMKDPEFMYKNMPWNTTIRRYVLNINSMKYNIEDFPRNWSPLDTEVEFPFVNPAYLGKDYCYSYLQSWQMSTDTMDLMKYDVCKKTSRSWHEDHKMVLEPVFAANPKPTSEDDGVVMAPVYDNSKGTTELIVWDAKDMKVLARFDNMVKVPLTIHGWWFSD
jgi:carotenoid cleavage dioxygenase-like enzyme